MAFSHRPTWQAARARGTTFDLGNYYTGGVPSKQIQERDLASHTTLKFREIGQGRVDEVAQRDLVKELQDREKQHFESGNNSYPKNYGKLKDADQRDTEEVQVLVDVDKAEDEFDDRDDIVSSSGSSESSSDDDDDEEDEQELLRELERIKKEREEERLRKEQESVELEAKILRQEQIKQASSVLPSVLSGSKVKRRWDEDIVFRNQARTEPEVKKRFINDTIRNDFHKKFLQKYIK